jgi:hypothetical protein
MALAALYAIAVIILFHQAMTCMTMFCDSVALPVFLPAGWLDLLPFSGPLNYVANPMHRWRFLIPAVVTNAIIYYFIGSAIGSVFGRLSKLFVR